MSGALPWTIRTLNPTTYLIRERDQFGEYPNIYARPISLRETSSPPRSPDDYDVILLIDTGCGTKGSSDRSSRLHDDQGTVSRLWRGAWDYTSTIKGKEPPTLHSFLSTYPVPALGNQPLNLEGRLPYLVALSHCHYDHIAGLEHFPTRSNKPSETESPSSSSSTVSVAPVTVLVSSYDPSFISPRFPNLYRHSLCEAVGLRLPYYKIDYWSRDGEEILWPPPDYVTKPVSPFPDVRAARDHSSEALVGTGIATYHTPGHTADSLSVYDSVSRHLFIGDMIYERESPDTMAAGEPPMPILFSDESDLADWYGSIWFLWNVVLGWNMEREDAGQSQERVVVEVLGIVPVAETGDKDMRREHGSQWLLVREESNGDFVEADDRSWPMAANDRDYFSWIHVRDIDAETDALSEPDALRLHPTPSTNPHSTLANDDDDDDNNNWITLAVLHRHKRLPRVKCGSAHVTTSADAESLLSSALLFIDRVISGDIPGHRVRNPYRPDSETWHWGLTDKDGKETGRFSLRSPLSVIKQERERVRKYGKVSRGGASLHGSEGSHHRRRG